MRYFRQFHLHSCDTLHLTCHDFGRFHLDYGRVCTFIYRDFGSGPSSCLALPGASITQSMVTVLLIPFSSTAPTRADTHMTLNGRWFPTMIFLRSPWNARKCIHLRPQALHKDALSGVELRRETDIFVQVALVSILYCREFGARLLLEDFQLAKDSVQKEIGSGSSVIPSEMGLAAFNVIGPVG